MKRILVMGCCGAGKSTLSRRLHRLTGLPLIHLDQHYWNADWVESEKSEWANRAKQLAEGEEWIIDGNYASTFEYRAPRADTIIYLDISTLKCLWRITKRILQYRGTTRPDMPEGCNERFDLEFYHYVLTFNLRNRKNLLKKLDGLKRKKNIYVLRNNREIESFVTEAILVSP